MLDDLMGKMQDAKKAMEESKNRLGTISVDSESGNGAVKVTANGLKKITAINIDEDLIKEGDQEQISDLVIVAVNRALDQAEKIHDAEMQNAARGIMPNIPGMM